MSFFPARERRRWPRMQPEDLVVFYWTGSRPLPYSVCEISISGARILAPEGFYPGTLIEMVFENRAAGLDQDAGPANICVCGRVLRRVTDGFCVEFVFGGRAERRGFRQFLSGLKRRNEDGVNIQTAAGG